MEFKGGSTFQFPANGHSAADARDTFDRLDVGEVISQELGRPGTSAKDIRVQTEPLDSEETDRAVAAIQKDFGIADQDQINPASVGPAWGNQVTSKALQGLFAFLIAVIIYISIRFEPKMAIAAIVALIHDLILAAGIYSLTQFEVTPSTVIALLTVLGYSLYDTIVVFDKVEENTRGLAGSTRSTYSEAAELAVNQTFMRSINTSLIALLPVSGLLFVGAFLLGAGTLKDLPLALFVGLAVRGVLLAVPRHPAAGRPQGARAAVQGAVGPRARQAQRHRPGRAAGVGGRRGRPSRWAPRRPGPGSVALAEDEPEPAEDAPAAPAATRRPAGKAQVKRKGGRPAPKRRR